MRNLLKRLILKVELMAEGNNNPPSYNELEESPYPSSVLDRNDPQLPPPYSPHRGAPPDYFSLFEQIQELRAENTNHFVFLRKAGYVLLSTVGGLVLIVVLMAVPVAMITVGIVFVNDCPFQPFIPIYLIVAGSLGITKNMAQISEKLLLIRIKRKMKEKTFKICYYVWKIGNILFTFLMFICVIVGSYFIYSNYGKLNNSGDYRSDLCHEGLYKFAFGITTACFGLAFLLICCLCCCGLCHVHDQRSVSNQQRERLNNESTQTNSHLTNRTLNAISNPLQNGHRPISESHSSHQIIEDDISIHNNDSDAAPVSSHVDLSHYTQETVV